MLSIAAKSHVFGRNNHKNPGGTDLCTLVTQRRDRYLTLLATVTAFRVDRGRLVAEFKSVFMVTIGQPLRWLLIYLVPQEGSKAPHCLSLGLKRSKSKKKWRCKLDVNWRQYNSSANNTTNGLVSFTVSRHILTFDEQVLLKAHIFFLFFIF